MMCLASLRLIRIAVVAVSGFLAVCVTSLEARAECGDYVIVGRPLLNPSNLSPEHRLWLAIHNVYSRNGPSDHGGSAPCHGPSCSRRDPNPTSPAPTAVVLPNTTDWAFYDARIPLLEFGPELFSPFSIGSLPDLRASPIEHPPRAV